jgi:anti-anti-sigma factor
MQISEERAGRVVVVAPVGRVDSTTSSALDEHLVGLAQAGERRIVLDFSGVDDISSAGLRVVLTLAKRTKDSGGRVALAALGDSVKQVFELAGFLPLFVVEATREAAVARAGAV